MSTLIPKFDLKNGGSTPTGAVNRPINEKLAEIVSVKDFGAIGDGTTDDTVAIQAAMDAGYNIVIPSGTYKVTSSINVRLETTITGYGTCLIVGYHTNAVFYFKGLTVAGSNAGKSLIQGVNFTNGATYTPSEFIRLGDTTTTGALNYLGAAINTEIRQCSFYGVATQAIGIYRAYNVSIKNCTITNFTGTGVKTFQSVSDNTTWAYGTSIYSTDFTNIVGNGIIAASGDIEVFGGVIEGCSLGGVEISATNGLSDYPQVSFHGVYFEANTNYQVKSTYRPTNVGFFGCQFKSGGISNNFIFVSGSTANYYNCTTPNNSCTFTYGNIRLLNCAYLYDSTTSLVDSIKIDDYPVRSNDPATANNLFKQININGTEGGGAAILLCTHESGTGNATNAELFLVRFGRSGNNYSVKSISREEGTDTSTYTFSIDASGYLQVTSAAGKTRYMVVSSTAGEFFAAGA
jgi:hypothetical protein